jgi:hypothetical protein
MLATPVDEEFAHFQLAFSGRVKEAGLSVLVELVDVAPVPDQQLRDLEPAEASRPVERRLLKFIKVRQVEVEAREHSFQHFGLPILGEVGENGLSVLLLVVGIGPLLQQQVHHLQRQVLIADLDGVENGGVDLLVRQVDDLFCVVGGEALLHEGKVAE